MQREKLSSSFIYREVQIEETKLKGFNKDSRVNTSYRVYDGEYAGVQFIQGNTPEEEGYKAAEANLSLKRPYGYPLETGSRHRDKTEAEYSDKELMDISREAIEYLKSHFPDFTFNGSVITRKVVQSIGNSLGLDYSDTDCELNITLSYKHKDSKDLDDGWFSIGQRKFDFKKFTDMADNYLTNFTNILELPDEIIIQKQYYEYLGKLTECLEAENLSLGTSLLSGKIGEKIFADSFTVTHDVSDKETWFTPFFDAEGVVQEKDKRIYIENGRVISGYADKRTAKKYGVPHTGSAGFNLADVPQNGYINLRIGRSDKTVKELLGGRLTVVPIRAYGGGFNDKGEYVTPVQAAMLCDGERFLGRLPEFAIKGNMFDMFGKGFIGVGSDDPVFNDKQILAAMELSK